MDPDRYSRQRRLPEVGDVGQARFAALEVELADSDTAELEREYLLRAGVGGVRPGARAALPFPHAAHFRAAGPLRVATGAWRALARLRAALGIETA